nr:MAG TPA: hypothetical protein [Caudoviricetes sp.]
MTFKLPGATNEEMPAKLQQPSVLHTTHYTLV